MSDKIEQAVDTLGRHAAAIGFLSGHIEGFTVPEEWEANRNVSIKELQASGMTKEQAVLMVVMRGTCFAASCGRAIAGEN